MKKCLLALVILAISLGAQADNLNAKIEKAESLLESHYSIHTNSEAANLYARTPTRQEYHAFLTKLIETLERYEVEMTSYIGIRVTKEGDQYSSAYKLFGADIKLVDEINYAAGHESAEKFVTKIIIKEEIEGNRSALRNLNDNLSRNTRDSYGVNLRIHLFKSDKRLSPKAVNERLNQFLNIAREISLCRIETNFSNSMDKTIFFFTIENNLDDLEEMILELDSKYCR